MTTENRLTAAEAREQALRAAFLFGSGRTMAEFKARYPRQYAEIEWAIERAQEAAVREAMIHERHTHPSYECELITERVQRQAEARLDALAPRAGAGG